jgi:hypothetical protein
MLTNPKKIIVRFQGIGNDVVTADTPGELMLKFAELYWWHDESITDTVKRLNQQINEAQGTSRVYDTPWEVLRGLQNCGFLTIHVDETGANNAVS